MGTFASIGKRAINAIVVFAALAAVLVASVAPGLMGGVMSPPDFIAGAVLPVVAVFVAALVANYVFFGRATLWNKSGTDGR